MGADHARHVGTRQRGRGAPGSRRPLDKPAGPGHARRTMTTRDLLRRAAKSLAPLQPRRALAVPRVRRVPREDLALLGLAPPRCAGALRRLRQLRGAPRGLAAKCPGRLLLGRHAASGPRPPGVLRRRLVRPDPPGLRATRPRPARRQPRLRPVLEHALRPRLAHPAAAARHARLLRRPVQPRPPVARPSRVAGPRPGGRPSPGDGPLGPPPPLRGAPPGQLRERTRAPLQPLPGRAGWPATSAASHPAEENPGGVLLSQGASPQVPSALAGLTAVFGMGTGVSPPPWPPETCAPHHSMSRLRRRPPGATASRRP